jgi:isopenicillin N synthase-like dioxygenase
MTLLPSNPVSGLMIRRGDGTWFEVDQEPRSFIVNSGDMLRRWSNDTFLSTVHRVRNTSKTDRYAIPFFFDPRVDTVIECLPSCLDPGGEPRYEPVVYRDYLRAFMGRSYAGNTEISM